ncbi:MAG: UPF0182 family protein [Acidimicrobiales bacterium]
MRVPNEAVLPSGGHPIRRYQAFLLIGIVAIIVLLIVVQGIADLYTNYLWYRSVNDDAVWRSMTATRIELEVFFIGVFFVACWVSLLIVDRVAPRALFLAPEQDFVRRYQAVVGRHRFALRTLVSAALALIVGGGTGSQWQKWLLFVHGGSFGVSDPQFHKDVGYFVFKLPFLSFLVDWTQVALIVLAIVCVAAYYLNGGLRFSGMSPRVDPRATSHFSVIFAALALLRAAGYFYVDRYALDVAPNGLFQGAGYTAVHVRLPALNLLAIIALAAFVMFVYNVYARGWMLPVVAAGLWAFLGIAIGVVFPWAVQSLQVSPAQSTVELPYLQRNIAATRVAYGLGNINQPSFPGNHDATTGVVRDDAQSLEDVDLWDPTVSSQTYQVDQRSKGFYSINGLSLDRYEVALEAGHPKQLTPVVVGVREISTPNLNRTTWVNTHLVYTHGYGAIMTPANTSQSKPNFIIGSVPVTSTSGAPVLKHPAVYYGLGETGYVVVDSAQPEYNYQSSSGAVTIHYSGSGGIPVGSFWQKAAFALRFHDFNLLVSKLVTRNSRIMFNQDVRTLVQKVAPFLQVDANPYPVIDDQGNLDWIVDAYTTTSYYPYSQAASTPSLPSDSGLQTSFNYVRNSVKAVVNAYTGKVTLYAVTTTDPILNTWERIYPGMFHPLSSMTGGLKDHLRYPQDLLSVEATMFGKYHIPESDASEFYNNEAAWQVALTGTGPSASYVQPVYQLLQLPGTTAPTFDAFIPLVPSGSGRAQNLSAFLVANSSSTDYGQLTAYVVPQGNGGVSGPAEANAAIASDAAVSQETTLLDQRGSKALFGPTLLIPIDDSLLYVRALFVASSSNPVPQLQYVVVDYGGTVAIAPTLLGRTGALAKVIGSAVASVGSNEPTNIPTAIADDIKAADAADAQALQALKDDNFALFGKDLAEVRAELAAAKAGLAQLAKGKGSSNKGSGTTPSSTTTTTTTGVSSTTSTTSTTTAGA